ncbi:MAG: membrane dipeptidase, partial [Clostridia bacterium]|nr:membrane dipeptidase [Clostridia bacterium]
AAAEKWFDDHADLFEKEAQSGAFTVIRTGADIEEMENKQGTGMILTVEGSAVLNGKLENVAHLRDRGVRMMTLTWNGSNEVGSGIMSKDSFGLTPFGVLAVKEMERLGIAVDISHASEKLFFDVAEHSTRPFVASHSNAKALCKHPRNLSDEQIKIMCQRDCLVGLNYFKAFLNDEPDKADVEDLYRHAEHFLSLGGANILAMGSDFDGASMPNGITGLESMEDVANVFLRHNLPEALVNKIFFENAAEFFKRFDK